MKQYLLLSILCLFALDIAAQIHEWGAPPSCSSSYFTGRGNDFFPAGYDTDVS